MPATTESTNAGRRGLTWKRLGWFCILYIASLAIIGAAAAALRALLELAFV